MRLAVLAFALVLSGCVTASKAPPQNTGFPPPNEHQIGKWVAATFSQNRDGSAVVLGSGATREEAVTDSREQCRKHGRGNCGFIDAWDDGCRHYSATGNNIHKTRGWAQGATYQAAIEACAAKGNDVCSPPIIGCAQGRS